MVALPRLPINVDLQSEYFKQLTRGGIFLHVVTFGNFLCLFLIGFQDIKAGSYLPYSFANRMFLQCWCVSVFS